MSWSSATRIVPNDHEPGSYFGRTVASSGRPKNAILVVSAPYEDVDGNQTTDSGDDRGAAYVYEDTGSGFTQVARLVADDGGQYDLFSFKAAAVVGTPGDALIAIGALYVDNSGFVYIFRDTGSGWAYVAGIEAEATESSFGCSVALVGTPDNATLFVGAQDDSNVGAVYVYRQVTGGTWTRRARLTAGDDEQAGSTFGSTITAAGGGDNDIILAVGAEEHDIDGLEGAGQAYIFEGANTTWTRTATLNAGDRAEPDAEYAFALSVDGTPGNAVLALGAYKEARSPTDEDVVDYGAVYMYRDAGTGWQLWKYLRNANATSNNEEFGYGVAVRGDAERALLVVGVHQAHRPEVANDDEGFLLAYVSSDNFTASTRLLPTRGWQGAEYGAWVSLLGTSRDAVLVAGAPKEDTTGNDSTTTGAAYVYRYRPHCFAAGTPVRLRSGATCAVEKLRPGHIVRGADGRPHRVVSVGTSSTTQLTRLVGRSRAIFVTPRHLVRHPVTDRFVPAAWVGATRDLPKPVTVYQVQLQEWTALAVDGLELETGAWKPEHHAVRPHYAT